VRNTQAREQALTALYTADTRQFDEIDITKLSKRATELAEGTWLDREAIDEQISATATRWRIERMPVIDRNIIRLGVYELDHTDLPIGVVLSEAVLLAKKFSTAKSSSFVNGVLAAIADSDRNEKEDSIESDSESPTE